MTRSKLESSVVGAGARAWIIATALCSCVGQSPHPSATPTSEPPARQLMRFRAQVPPAVPASPPPRPLDATTAPPNAAPPSDAPPRPGRLAPEVIQSAVRDAYHLFRRCYEAGLARDPKLEGRVSALFVIGRDGSVSNVGDGGSDLPDASVGSCILGAFYRIRFLPPEGGIVTVVYPIMLKPGSPPEHGSQSADPP